MGFAAEQGLAPQDVAASWEIVENIADDVNRHRKRTGSDLLDSLNAVVFSELGYQREIDSHAPEFLLLPSVVKARRGGCVGLSALYLALGERLNIPLRGVLVPGHFFVREIAGPGRNVELLRRGEAMNNEWYRAKYGPWSSDVSAYMRPLRVLEVMSVHWFNMGNHYRDAGDLPRAQRAYENATREFPMFAEAEASLGAVRQMTGDLAAAEAAYRNAANARSDLPGLAHNRSVLEAQKHAAAHTGRASITTEADTTTPPRRSLR